MTPQVEEALGHLLGRVKAELWEQYYREPYDPVAKHNILVRMGELHSHMCKVAARSGSPAELRTRLIRDDTIHDEPVIEWYNRDGHYRAMTPTGSTESGAGLSEFAPQPGTRADALPAPMIPDSAGMLTGDPGLDPHQTLRLVSAPKEGRPADSCQQWPCGQGMPTTM